MILFIVSRAFNVYLIHQPLLPQRAPWQKSKMAAVKVNITDASEEKLNQDEKEMMSVVSMWLLLKNLQGFCMFSRHLTLNRFSLSASDIYPPNINPLFHHFCFQSCLAGVFCVAIDLFRMWITAICRRWAAASSAGVAGVRRKRRREGFRRF